MKKKMSILLLATSMISSDIWSATSSNRPEEKFKKLLDQKSLEMSVLNNKLALGKISKSEFDAIDLKMAKEICVAIADYGLDISDIWDQESGNNKNKESMVILLGIMDHRYDGNFSYLDNIRVRSKEELQELTDQLEPYSGMAEDYAIEGKTAHDIQKQIQDCETKLRYIDAAREIEITEEIVRGYESAQAVALSSAVQTTNILSNVTEQRFGFTSGSGDILSKFGFWARGFGNMASQISNIRNSKAYDLSNIGLLVGCDIEVSDNVSAGVATIFSKSNVWFYHNKKLHEKANVFSNYGAMFYNQWIPTDNFSLDAQGSAIFNNVTLDKGSKKSSKVAFGAINAKYYLQATTITIVPKIGFNGLIGSFGADEAKSIESKSKLNDDISKVSMSLGLGFQKTFITTDSMRITPEMHFTADYMIAGNAFNFENGASVPIGDSEQLKLLEMTDKAFFGIGASLNVKQSASLDVIIGIDASATATHLGARMGLKSFQDITGDFYSIGGYLKIKLSL